MEGSVKHVDESGFVSKGLLGAGLLDHFKTSRMRKRASKR